MVFVRLTNMLETMNKQQIKFVNKMWKYDLLHETDLRFSSPKLYVNLCDDGVYFLPLESGLEEVFDPLLTTLSLVALSSPNTIRVNTTFIMTLPDPPVPLAQSPKFEEGKTLGISASVDEDDTCYELDAAFIEVHDFDGTLVGRSYVDVVVIISATPDIVDNIYPEHLETFHTFLSCSLPSPPFECCNMLSVDYHDMLKGNVVGCVESLGIFRGYDPFLDPYNLYLENMSAKITTTTAFDYPTDFFEVVDKFRRALTIISGFIFWYSYSHSSELHGHIFEKLM